MSPLSSSRLFIPRGSGLLLWFFLQTSVTEVVLEGSALESNYGKI